MQPGQTDLGTSASSMAGIFDQLGRRYSPRSRTRLRWRSRLWRVFPQESPRIGSLNRAASALGWSPTLEP